MSLLASVFNKIWHEQKGYTLVEIVVVLAIISILASVSVLKIEKSVYRKKEAELQQTLMRTREAIDLFHQDWIYERMERTNPAASPNGYPKRLEVLVQPMTIELEGAQISRRYLRALPQNPFAPSGTEIIDMWLFTSSTDQTDSRQSNGVDVFDIRSKIERTALDGTEIIDW